MNYPAVCTCDISRGDRREDIYQNDADRPHWLGLLGEAGVRHYWLCHAYCLMDNHFHIVLETVDGNLSAGMRQLKGVYTQWHNRASRCFQFSPPSLTETAPSPGLTPQADTAKRRLPKRLIFTTLRLAELSKPNPFCLPMIELEDE